MLNPPEFVDFKLNTGQWISVRPSEVVEVVAEGSGEADGTVLYMRSGRSWNVEYGFSDVCCRLSYGLSERALRDF